MVSSIILFYTRVPYLLKTIFPVFPTKQKLKSEIKAMRKGRKADLCERAMPLKKKSGRNPIKSAENAFFVSKIYALIAPGTLASPFIPF